LNEKYPFNKITKHHKSQEAHEDKEAAAAAAEEEEEECFTEVNCSPRQWRFGG
jgi:hypothetical protein